MSAGLHVVLSYLSASTALVAEFYNSSNVQNSALPVPYIIAGTYRFYLDDVLLVEINGSDRVEQVIVPPTCQGNYRVDVTYTANDVPQPISSSMIVLGTDYVFGSFLSSITIPGGEELRVAVPVSVTPTGIVWSGNYALLDPQPVDPLVLIAPGNGIYEISFLDSVSGFRYFSTIEATFSTETSYLRLLGNDGALYGSNGTPLTVTRLSIQPVDSQSPFRHRNYLNGVLYSDYSSVSTVQMVAGDQLDFLVSDCCHRELDARTVLVGCTVVPPVLRTARTSYRSCGCGH